MTDEEFLREIETAERELKIYIYPVPQDYVTVRMTDKDTVPHFKSEYMFRQYLSYYFNNDKISINDSRKDLIVNDPILANAFLIDHEWARYNRLNCQNVLKRHINSIIKNVVDHYPYYNRSQGYDHFMMNAYDKGAFCDMECSDHGDSSVIFRVSNASFIGNYGMDRTTFYESETSTKLRKDYQKYKVSCHRAGHDIVIPQLIQEISSAIFREFKTTHIPYREFDSSFSGSEWGERQPIEIMHVTAKMDYEYNGIENIVSRLTGSADHSLKFRGYFMYHPCGKACWSLRSYEALAVDTIPMLVTDGGI